MHHTTLLPRASRSKKTQHSHGVFLLLFFALVFPLSADGKRQTPWSKYERPSKGKSESIGKYAGGCVLGAASLPSKAPGLESIRRYRNRYYGHPVLIEFLRDYGRSLEEQGIAAALIGDLSQPRGGLMGYGHRSHQIGLDADVWFSRPKKTQRNKDEYFPSLVNRKKETIVKSRLNARSIAMLRTAAEDPRVARIFVHWVIKKSLCAMPFKERDWLGRIRAWYGHDRHFHIRLKCPQGSPHCVDQRIIPPGDGCGAEVYFSHARVNKRKAKDRAARKKRLAAAKKAPKATSWGIFKHRVHRIIIDTGTLLGPAPKSTESGTRTSKRDAKLDDVLNVLSDYFKPFSGGYVARVFLRSVVYTTATLISPESVVERVKSLPSKGPYWPKKKRLHPRCAAHLLMNPRTGMTKSDRLKDH